MFSLASDRPLRAILFAALSVLVLMSACESTETTGAGTTNESPDATGTSDGSGQADGSALDGQAVGDAGPGSDLPLNGCVSDDECDDLDACTHNVCDEEAGTCSFPADLLTSNPDCQGLEDTCGDGVCDPHESPEACPADCDEGPGPQPSEGSCAGKCGEYDAEAGCQCDSSCVEYEDCCGDFETLCSCDPLNPPSCLSDADCGTCNSGGDLCAGVFTCQGGQCAVGAAIVCDTTGDTECLTTTCDPFSGSCSQNPNDQICEDGEYCTADICDPATGDCVFEAIESCGLNYACESSEAPTSNSDTVNACVCEGIGATDEDGFLGDLFCCESSWDSLCVQEAQDNCAVVCDCEVLATESSDALICETDEECGWCNPENPCDGAWTCVEGTCTQQDKVVCDASGDTECLQNSCDPETLHCEMAEMTGACDDEDPCTLDACGEDGLCTHEAGCGTNHPCGISDFPQSKDETLNACVCEGVEAADGFEGDSYCCENAWDSLCVNEATDYCGAVCDCTDPAFDPTCAEDSDCVFCSEDVCVASWGCVESSCQDTGPLICEVTDDASCIQNTCSPSAAGCEVVPSNDACDDNDACSWDLCDAETGACHNDAIPGCAGEPPFECVGGGEPSATGCEAVETYDGCCDPWGRVLWCGDDGNTYCMDCSDDAYCGWNGSWYWCSVDEPNVEEPTGAAPYQCPGLEYAP